ncbi:MAG: EamA/RhaT family transporter [Chitinophagia bacterium]|nr:EamA/RhaT family transporter [Chitinophagia bacterium]
MLYIVITILFNVVISILFKLFSGWKIDTFQAIVVNYSVCVATGICYLGKNPFTSSILHQSWFPWGVLMGMCFISIFNVIARCTAENGITVTTIANKVSLIIPVVFAVLLYHDSLPVLKIAGIALAIPAVWLTTHSADANTNLKSPLIPLLLFVGSGLLDSLVNYVQRSYLQESSEAVYTILCFSVAGIVGLLVLLIRLITKKTTFALKNLLAGIALGIPNFFSIYFLIKSLGTKVLQSSALIPIINVGILVSSTVAAMLLFKESANYKRLIGIGMAIIAILLIAFS